MKRSSGLLLHITSLPSNFGIGDLGPSACSFIDFLAESGQSYWQLLPLNRTEEIFSHSPYSSVSAFALNPLLISPALLVKKGLLKKEDIKGMPAFSHDRVDYKTVADFKYAIFDKAYLRFKQNGSVFEDFDAFCEKEKEWLDDYALFLVIKNHFEGKTWNEWPEDARDRDPDSLTKFNGQYEEDINKIKFLQFVFYSQWESLKDYAVSKNIKLIGDLPIYVGYDSVDVWTRPELYKLNEDKTETYVAGVPPDYFSGTGQRWGNPVYDWERNQRDGYSWWMKRIEHNLKFFDCVRVDHFRGLVAYWEIRAEEETAVNGYWVRVPHDDFLTKICGRFSKEAIIAEDLGLITPDVVDVMNRFGLPGMKVLLFAFNGDMNTHPYLPHNYTENFLVYTGTHDNNTTLGWYQNEATVQEKSNMEAYLGRKITDKNVNWSLIELAMKSRAKLSIFPVQDILCLGQEARMNTPATTENNWQWRLGPKALTSAVSNKLREMTIKTGRGNS